MKIKKWIVALFIICGLGMVTSAGIAGHIYFNEMKTYQDADKKILDQTKLNNIYIDSDVPIEIYPTTGEAYVEFNQTFIDFLGKPPVYELDTEVKEDSTYINFKQKEREDLWIGVKKHEVAVRLYLPQKAINELKIQADGYLYFGGDNYQINLAGFDINTVDISTFSTDIILDGNYKKININTDGSVKVNSKSLANIELEGYVNYDLEGDFSNIKIREDRRGGIINSITPAQVLINGYNSDIKLYGKYSSVVVDGSHNSIDAKSDTICSFEMDGYNERVRLNGAFKTISIGHVEDYVDIETTIAPQSIRFTEYMNATSRITLPSNVSGIKLIYRDVDNYYYEEMPSYRMNLVSDFELSRQVANEGEVIYTYGDGSSKIITEFTPENTIEIIDGGYSSNNNSEENKTIE